MYVCICNGVTEDDIRGHLEAGCDTTKAVRAACGMQPGCGSCTKRLCAMVSQHRTAGELVDALTGGPLPLTVVETPVEPLVQTPPRPDIQLAAPGAERTAAA